MIDFKVDTAKCIKCKACVAECPVLIIDGKTEYPEIIKDKEKLCIKCQHCLAVCPTGAISIWGKEPEDSVPVSEWIPQSGELELLYKTRRSVRSFKNKRIDPELIHYMLEVAAFAPTSHNENSVLFTVVDDNRNFAKLRSLIYEQLKKANDEGRIPKKFASLKTFQQLWFSKRIDILFRGAPHLLIASAPKKAANPVVDSAIALSYFELLANTNELGTLWDGYAQMAFEALESEIRIPMGIPEDHVIGGVMLFGKPAVKFIRSIQSDGLNMNIVEL